MYRNRFRHSPVWLLGFCALLAMARPAESQVIVPDLYNSLADMQTYTRPSYVVVMVLPDGSAPPFTQSFEAGTGAPADGSVVVTINDHFHLPIAGFPADEVWLAPNEGDGTFKTCDDSHPRYIYPEGAVSDSQGRLFFSEPLAAGGWFAGLPRGYIDGEALRSNGGAGVPLYIVSPDINGDLRVNLQDTGFFCEDLFFDYHLRSDFNGDGTIDLTDAGFMGASIGKHCP